MLNALYWLWLGLVRGRRGIARRVFRPNGACGATTAARERLRAGELCIFGIRLQIGTVTL